MIKFTDHLRIAKLSDPLDTPGSFTLTARGCTEFGNKDIKQQLYDKIMDLDIVKRAIARTTEPEDTDNYIGLLESIVKCKSQGDIMELYAKARVELLELDKERFNKLMESKNDMG